MKKLTLLIVLLVAVGMTGFALELKPTFTLTGSATLTWGVDLNTGGHTGFDNAGTAELTVNFFPDASTDSKTGKGNIYGSIKIENIELYWKGADTTGATLPQTGDKPAVSAQLFIGPMEIGVNGAPGMSSDSATLIEDDAAPVDLTGVAIIDGFAIHNETSFNSTTYGSQKGTYAKYKGENFWAKASLVSKGNWTANTTDSYAVGGEGSFTVGEDLLTLGAGLFQGFNWAPNPLSGYVSVASTVPGFGPVKVGLDWEVASNVFGWEVGGSAQLNLNQDKDHQAYVSLAAFYNPLAAATQASMRS
jgi:hypothetical protein